jgi:Flp pilus assembly protein TadD
VTGELGPALEEFAAALALDPAARYFRRAAEACLAAQRLSLAEEYATKAAELDPQNAIAHRTLAKVFRVAGRLGEARGELETAAQLDPMNPHIAAELEELRKPPS